MIRQIWFDMDGTIADLYGVENWLTDLVNGRTRPYIEAKPLVNMQVLARILNRLINTGYEVGIITWTCKGGTPTYNAEVAQAKIEWLKKHLRTVHFTHINIIDYGTPKWIYANNNNPILFDDEEKNRNEWRGTAYNTENIIETLRALK